MEQLRPHSPQDVDRLRESVARFGRLRPVVIHPCGVIIDGRLRLRLDPTWPVFVPTDGRLNPILVDACGRIIDGRHRYEIDKHWPRHALPQVDTDEKTLNVILELDRWVEHEKLSNKLSNGVRAELSNAAARRDLRRQVVADRLAELGGQR